MLKKAEITVIAVLITCFNWKDKTLDTGAKLANHSEIFGLYNVDRASSDGTHDLLIHRVKNIQMLANFTKMILIGRDP